jgi:TrmH family RNA methyltransferase
MVLSKNKIKYLNSLSLKKNRDKEGVFIAEGHKLVFDLLPYFKAKLVVATSEWLGKNSLISEEVIEIEDLSEMKKITQLSTPSTIFAVFYKRDYCLDLDDLIKEKSLILALDSVQDPGNLGTIIRIADWFGIKHIICSYNTVDIYNSKTVQATMGAMARVKIYYTDLFFALQRCRDLGVSVYGTFLDGESVYDKELQSNGVIVMGNEGNGISEDIGNLVTDRLLIPNYPLGEVTSESLNVAVATAIICSEFRRR